MEKSKKNPAKVLPIGEVKKEQKAPAKTDPKKATSKEPTDAEKLKMFEEREQKEGAFRAQKCAERINEILKEYNCGTPTPMRILAMRIK